ncbi:MAG: ABC transporter ATP-binding protein [Chloroflexi bacterium]|nr:ABC transporter ATP-binding protein [Chloroflexota bacterium]
MTTLLKESSRPDDFADVIRRGTSATSSTQAFSARNVTVRIGGNTIVDDVSINGQRGDVVGIIGPNGAGKTTLLKVLAGLLKPTMGSATIGDAAIDEMPVSTRSRRISYVPQSTGLHPFTALEMVLMGRYPHLRRFQIEAEDDTEIAISAMKRMRVDQFIDRRVDTLSGGERQRVLLARALAQHGDVLFVDEPITSLDIKHQLMSLQVLKDEAIKRGVAVCAVLHDLNMAARYCDQLVLMLNGHVVADGEPKDVITEESVHSVFGVHARVEFDPGTKSLKVEVMEPA